MPFGFWSRVYSRKHALDGGADAQTGRALLGECLAHCKAQDFVGFGKRVSCAKTVQMPMGGAYWRNRANTIEPSVCGGDATYLMSNYFDHFLLLGCIAVLRT